MQFHVGLSLNLIFLQAKFSQFLLSQFLGTVLSKEGTIHNGKYNYHIKKSSLTLVSALRIGNLSNFDECIEW
jgi:endo-1,4-beta-D-glucanase Y